MKMIKKLLSLTLSMLLALGTTALALPFETFEQEIPTEPEIIDESLVHIVAEYDAAADLSRYTLTLKEDAQFADGSAVTARDVLFSLYTYLDPGYAGEVSLGQLTIAGLRAYQLQCSEEHIREALETMQAIRDAGADHVWNASDPWSEALQQTYWSLDESYNAACDAQYVVLAQLIVDTSTTSLLESSGAFGLTGEEIAADDRLKTAYAMVQQLYAFYEDGDLTTNHSRTVWRMSDGILPSVEDLAMELKEIYNGDFALCWSTECPDSSLAPDVPDIEAEFIRAFNAESDDLVASISGIRLVDEKTVAVNLTGIDIGSSVELFGIPMLALNSCGDAEAWDPDAGLYGHPFGDTSSVREENAVRLYEPAPFDPFASAE